MLRVWTFPTATCVAPPLSRSEHQAVGRIVALYAKDDFPFALARMWQVFVDQTGWATRVFRDRSEATAWVRELAIVRFGIQIAEL